MPKMVPNIPNSKLSPKNWPNTFLILPKWQIYGQTFTDRESVA